MSSRYIIKTNGRAVEMSKPNSTILLYKLPYDALKKNDPGFIISNHFIVYILLGRNKEGKDSVYVGKSKNSIKLRPTSHEDKDASWSYCFVLTQFKERSFFNDGTIQYLENSLNQRINEVKRFYNTTKTTNSDTANDDDQSNCDDYLYEIYPMLDVLGLDLISGSETELDQSDDEDQIFTDCLPDGIYTFSRKIKRLDNRTLKGKMRYEKQNHKFILLKGSDVTTESGKGLAPNVDRARNRASLENEKLLEDVVLDSPSACASFITGAACNGWMYWKDTDGNCIDNYRHQNKQ